jgi:alpha-L-fucosidase
VPVESGKILEAVGQWLDANGKSIYGTERGSFSWNSNANYTRRGNVLYIHEQYWPGETSAAEWLPFFQPATVIAISGLKAKVKSVHLLKTGQPVPFTQDNFSLRLTTLPSTPPDHPATVFEVECEGEPVIDHTAIRSLWPRYKAGIS